MFRVRRPDVDARHTVRAVSHINARQQCQGFAQVAHTAPRDFLGAYGADGGDFVCDPRALPDDRDGFAEAIAVGLVGRQGAGNGKCQRRRTQEQSDGPCQSIPVIHGYDCPSHLQYLLTIDPSQNFVGIKSTFVGISLLEATLFPASSGKGRDAELSPGRRRPLRLWPNCGPARFREWSGYCARFEGEEP